MLQQSDLLLQRRGIVKHSVFLANILTVNCTPLHIIEVETIWVESNLGGVIEKHTCCLVTKVVAKSILGRVVNPLFYPHLFPRLYVCISFYFLSFIRCCLGPM